MNLIPNHLNTIKKSIITHQQSVAIENCERKFWKLVRKTCMFLLICRFYRKLGILMLGYNRENELFR